MLSSSDKKITKAIIDLTWLSLFWSTLAVALSKNYRFEMLIVVTIVYLLNLLNAFLAIKYKKFVFGIVGLSLLPLTFGFLLWAIVIWMNVFDPHWSWISIVLGTFWGMWLIPILLPKLSKQIESEIMQPKTKLGKVIIGILVGLGGVGGATAGRVASRASKTGSNWGIILVGFGMASFAFILQYAFVHQAWNGYIKKKSQEKPQ